MLHHLKGRIHSRGPDHVVIDNQGIGYQVYAPVDVTQAINIGDEVLLYLHHHITLDQNRAHESLYGFLTTEVRELFRLLLTVKGLGPRQSLTILSSCGVDSLIKAIQSGDSDLLKKIKGIGPKTAQRIVLELKDKVEAFTTSSTAKSAGSTNQLVEDTIAALISLGYKETESQKAVKEAHQEHSSVDVASLVRFALQKI